MAVALLATAARGAAVAAPFEPSPADEIIITASRAAVPSIAASQGTITTEELKLRPAYRVGELLESVPGLVVTVHSGEGKANQFLARGFNLDHGTDIAISIDDIPVNRPTDAHGEGYADLNFIVPEVLGSLEYAKGTYYPSTGNFGDVASVHLRIADTVPTEVTLAGDTFGGFTAYAGATHSLSATGRVLAAVEFNRVNGPFNPPGDFNKQAGVVRFSQGTPADGLDVTGQYYHGTGRFATDQPQRAIDRGLIGRYGTLDPTDGTSNDRLSVSTHYRRTGTGWHLAVNVFYVRSSQTLWNNFTHFLEDPVYGDQEEQDEARTLFGGGLAFTQDAQVGSIVSTTTLGIQGRYDDVLVDRRHTVQRVVLPYCELLHVDGTVTQYSVGQPDCTLDRVHLHDVGIYAENTTHLTPWLRIFAGVREEFFGGDDRSLLPGGPFSVTPFSQDLTLFQPKATVTVGPFAKTEIYASVGRGFHSNDIRSVSGTVLLENVLGFARPTPLLVKVDSTEVGLRSDLIPLTHVEFAAFLLHVGSEQIYDQDQGEDVPGAPSRRYGFELSGQVHPRPWLELNADLSYSHARFIAAALAAYGDAGPYIPNAPAFVGSLGALVDHLGPWFGSVQVRILGPYPLISDNSQRDRGYTETNARIGYRFSSRLRAQVEIFNLFDVHANAGAFYYTSVIPGDNGVPTADHQNHPLEPISARFSLTASF